MAEPLILLTGVVLWRLCRLYKKTEDQQKSTENRYDDVSRTSRAKTTRFFDPGRELASILAPQKRSRVLSGAAPGVPDRFCGHSGRSWAAPAAPRDASKTLPGCLPNALGHHGASREGRGIDFESILDASGQLRAALGIDLGSIFKRLAQKD